MNKHYIKQILTIVLLSLLSLSASAREVVIPEGTVSIDADSGYMGDTTITSIVIPNSVTEIGWHAFSGCTSLTSVEIPNSVTEIEEYAFSGCTGLTSVEIPNSVTRIDSAAFSHCISLTSVEIPNSVMYLSGFSDCTGLTSIVIPNSVTEIDWGAFTGCTSLTSVEIPNSVTEIWGHAFSGCTGLTSVEIPNSVTEIGAGAFYGCTGLTSVEIPNSVTEIGWYAFSDCTALTSVEIPNSVTLIYYEAFYGCTNLSRVVCYAVEPPAYYSSYYYHVFSDETLKGTLYVPAKSIDAYKSSKLWGQFKTILPIEETEFPTVTIDETIRVCEHDLPIMWRGHEIYGDTVLSFNDTLRYMNLSVQRPVVIEMFDTVFCGASYKDYGFAIKDPVSGVYTDTLSTAAGCDSIVILHLEVNGELVIPEGTKTISYKDGYHGNKCITTVKIPNSVTEIGEDAFYGCKGLTSVEIPNSVTSLSGFNNCTGLTSIEIPNSVTTIAYDAFLDCTGLTSVEIPNSVTEIGFDAFGGCTGLTSVEIPNSVTKIGEYAFHGCAGLTSVEIPNSVTEIGPDAFYGCTGLTSVEIPNSVTSLSGFSGCTGLTSIEIPNSVSKIGEYAFHGCAGLTSVEIPNSVTEIDNGAFKGCSNLSRVVCYAVEPPHGNGIYDLILSDTLYVPGSSLSAYTQDENWGQFKTILPIEGSELPTVTIDETIRVCEHDLPIMWRGHEIYGDTVLSFNDTLWYMNLHVNSPVVIEKYDTVICGASYKDYGFAIKDPVSGVYTDTLSTAAGCDSIVVLHLEVNGELVIPEGTKTISYKDGYHGNKCITTVKIPNSVTEIGRFAFEDCSGLTSVEIPSSVTEIEEYAFSGCTGLTSVEIPSSVTSIGEYAFADCEGLTSIEVDPKNTSYASQGGTLYNKEMTALICVPARVKGSFEIPNSVTSIGQYAFDGCSGLTSVVIPNSVTKIGEYAFADCEGLTSVVIPSSVTNMGEYTFYGCRFSSVTCYAIEPPSQYNAFGKGGGVDTFFVPAQSVEAYKKDKEWYHTSATIILPISDDAPVSITQTLTICDNELPIKWNGHWVKGDTTLALGADTVVDLRLYVNHSMETILYDTVLCGSSYQDWGWSMKEPQSGTYVDTFTTATGCDSIVTLHLYVMGDELVIPEGTVTIWYKDGYHGNKCITTVKIPNSVTTIGPDAFLDCTGLTSVEIPNSVTEIGFDAFGGCTGLTSVEIPNSVTEIGWYAFSGCTSLTSVEIPSSVTEIGEGAFSRCTGLTSVEIPNSVTQIDSAAFSHCISLTSVEIPNSVTLIDYEAFYGCTNLSRVVCYAVEPPAYYSSYYYHVFSDETLKGTLYVPAKSIDDYKSSKLWGQFKTILPIEETEVPTVTIDETISVCENDLPVIWREHEIYQSDTTFLVSSALSDTLYYIHLDIHASSITKLTAEVKKGEGYELGDSVYYQPGVYDQIYVSAMGCDSIIRLSLSYVEEADTIPNVSDGTAVANLLTTLPDGTNVYYANGLLFKMEKGELLPVMYDSVYAVVGDSVLPQNDSIFIPCSVMIEGKSYDVKSVDMDAACGKMKIETYYSWSYQYKMLDYLKVPDCVEYLNTGYYKWGMNWRSVFDITPNPNLKLEYDSNSVQIYWHDNDALDLMRRDFVNNSYFGVDFYLDDSLLTLIVPDGVDKLRNYHIHNSFDTIVLPNNDLMVGRDNRSFFTYNCNFLSLSNALVDDESQDYFYGGTLITTDVLNLRDWKAWCETSTSDYVTYKKILYQGQEIGNDLLLGEGIQSISTNSFKKFDFNSIYLPSTMTTIEKNAFAKLDLQSLSLSRNIDLSATGIQSADTLFFRGTMAEWCADPVVSIPYNVLVIEGQVYDKNTKSLFVAEGVELIHSQAFSICPNIRTLVLPSTLTEISDGAFKSCISLTTVTCYAPEPPVALGSTFGNYNGYLYIPCDYRPDYDIHVCWGSFKHVECITAESTVVDDVVVEPDHVSADISWPKIDGVVGYTIDISLNGKVILTLNFNEDGQLVNIDFSKALQSVKPAPSQTYALTSLRSAVEGFRFSVTGLEEATTYQYTLKVLGDAGKVIESHSGEFTTLGESNGVEEKPAEMDDFSISVENGIVMVSVDVSIPVSFYNLQGQCLFNHMGSCAFRAPYTGVYVVRCGVKAIKVLVR